MRKVSDDLVLNRATHSAIADVMCYYEEAHAPQLEWGSKQEVKAMKLYATKQRKTHKLFRVHSTGLWISITDPFVASSPDGLITCKCCNKGCVEVKCPWKYRFQSISIYQQQDDACVSLTAGVPSLKTDHTYYAQVQTHMFCTQTTFCDFVVCTAAKSDNILIIRVTRDDSFIVSLVQKARVFFTTCIIPEISTRSVELKVREHYVKRVMDNMLLKLEQQGMEHDYTGFQCGSCGVLWSQGEDGIQCDLCNLWYHYKCAKIQGDESFLSDDSDWMCEYCSDL